MYPESYLYSREHEWFKIEGSRCVMGITQFAQDELGEVVFVELPEVGADFEAGDEIGTIESVKAVSEIYTSLAGKVTKVNEALNEAPETVNSDPHGNGWLVELELSSTETGDLMSADEYESFLENG